MVSSKHDIEAALLAEKRAISAGQLKEDNPLDLSDDFKHFCEACRRGDLKVCQEMIMQGVNINARDSFDNTPLILASLCGHYEVVQLLLESGALCERDTFQGERCLYNALNNRIRNLLLEYDYSKSTDPLQPLAAHVASLLSREHPKTSDLALVTETEVFHIHKFLAATRSPYFARRLAAAPGVRSWKVPNGLHSESLQAALRFLYLGEVTADLGEGEKEQEILTGIDKLSRQLEIPRLFEHILESGDRRLVRQRRTEEVSRGRDELDAFFRGNVVKYKIEVDTSKAEDVKWDKNNYIFADILLRADEDPLEPEAEEPPPVVRKVAGPLNGIPIGPFSSDSWSPSRTRKPRRSVLYPAHKAMLLRSEYFLTMFSSSFKEAQDTEYLQIVTIDCTPEVLEVILTFLYTEKADFGLDVAIDVLFTADLLFIEKLKVRAAQIISTLGNGGASVVEADNSRGEAGAEEIDIYDVIRAGWDTRVQRLEEFGARYLAQRLEHHIDREEFAELVKESAARVKNRQETDTVELIDDIRYELSERYRLRFEEAGIDEMEEAAGGLLQDSGSSETGQSPPQNFQSIYAPEIDGELQHGVIRTLDGEIAGDEFAQDAMNYQILLGKIDTLLASLNLDA
ncbi:hypothetical protein EJ06DRAFT_526419 [Trichodelitschia bisporula]|uniref:BTB domain-containing protein n=1 Tax=Trichodelitschia bisporula TaxID=703511 RepID=A0A6G1I8M0_9PEZI|nr:hypothetical protein EJ06DRAFT_526419 [Trichodelitschia bisporula]